SDLKLNSEVYLSASHKWGFGAVNPLTCSGTVIDYWVNYVRVKWANGTINAYRVKDDDLIPKIQPSREAARIAARRNPNLTAIRENDKWILKLKDKLVINDGGKK
ncbi:MAG: hypothetical protein ACRCTW_02425, partial [Lactococcus garvieae]